MFAATNPHKEIVADIPGIYREEFPYPLHNGVFTGINLFLLVALQEHHQTGKDQEQTEYIENPLEAMDEGGTDKDEQEPHDDGAQDTPEQHPLEVLLFNAKAVKYHDHDEYIINRQSVFNHITGQVFQGQVLPINVQGRLKIQTFDADRVLVQCNQLPDPVDIPIFDAMDPVPEEHQQHIEP